MGDNSVIEISIEPEKKTEYWKVYLRQDRCSGCDLCIEVCPVDGIFTLADEIGRSGFKPIIVNQEGCTGCRVCEMLCPDVAITIVEDKAN
ncbi:4Fe-4S dicluster domain-containing protein [bacterium]|nr:4Fe-4S dicluster domain-containing protein [bacterium]